MSVGPERAKMSRQAIRLRAEGASTADIAKWMHFSRGYVSRLINDPDGKKEAEHEKARRSTCIDCGVLVTGRRGKRAASERCGPCSGAERNRVLAVSLRGGTNG